MSDSSHYTVLARRFRPQAFDQVVGQEHIARALQNAIRQDRVAHAYLFTGARGVGKTSTARILAKALNCPQTQDGVPCNACEICQGISAGNDVDVLEIDGASNRGIDDIRSLRANVGVRSMRTRYKVYIIDEVHMLTREAFNALLKTLEEPPPSVKFVFCTTEPNKVPDTILSRCQRFDFSSIADASIVDRLRDIASAEKFDVTDEALELVARRARGSMRDSQSLFDQLLAFSEGSVTADDVHRMLGTAADEQLVRLFDAITGRRPGDVLNVLDESLAAGVQAGELADQVIAYVRDLMVLQAAGAQVSLNAVAARFREPLQAQAAGMGLPAIMAAFQIMAEAKQQMFRSTFARTILEMALIRLSVLEDLTAISDLLSGRMPDLPSPAQAAASDAGTAEKKNAAESQPVAAVAGETQVEISDAELSELLRQAGRGCGLKVTSALRSLRTTRRIDDGSVELVIPAGATGVRRVLEDHLQELADALRQRTGQPTTLAVRVDSDSPPEGDAEEPRSARPEPADTPPVPGTDRDAGPPPNERRFVPSQQRPAAPRGPVLDDVDTLADRFVQQVSEVFGGKVVRVVAAPEITASADKPDPGSDEAP